MTQPSSSLPPTSPGGRRVVSIHAILLGHLSPLLGQSETLAACPPVLIDTVTSIAGKPPVGSDFTFPWSYDLTKNQETSVNHRSFKAGRSCFTILPGRDTLALGLPVESMPVLVSRDRSNKAFLFESRRGCDAHI